jgi:hypothetical protein
MVRATDEGGQEPVRSSRSRLSRIDCSASVVEVGRPKVTAEGKADAPQDGSDGLVSDSSIAEKSTYRIGDRCKGLVFGKLT